MARYSPAVGHWVKVTWSDALGTNQGWLDVNSEFNLKEHGIERGLITVGRVIHLDEEQIILAQSYDAREENVLGLQAIPRPWLHKIERLSV